MARKRHTAEEIVAELRQVDGMAAQGRPGGRGGLGDRGERGHLRDELLDGQVFYSLAQAKFVIESWRRHHDSDRPRSALGYRPPAPKVVPWPTPPATRAVVPRPVMH